jgi:hypothetical protein
MNVRLPREYEILNYGTGGYNTYQACLRMRMSLAIHSFDVVIYGFFGHNFHRNVADATWITTLNTSFGEYLVPPHLQSFNGRIIPKRGGRIPIWPLEERSALVATAHKAAIHIAHRSSYEEKIVVMADILLQMHNLASQHDAGFMVVGLADIPEWVPSWAQEHDINFVNCSHPGWGTDPTLRLGVEGHPTTKLQEWFADCAFHALVANLRLR